MVNKKVSICFINGTNPTFLGGISNYQTNLINYLKQKDKNLEITWVYKSNKKERYTNEGINYLGLKVISLPFIDDILFNKKVRGYLDRNYFDIINSHAIWGYWMKNYKKKENQILINTYHGVTFPYYKIHLKRFGIIKKILFSPLLPYSYFIEKPPIKMADKIICVSEKVKKEIEKLYYRRDNLLVIRTGVDLTKFKERSKEKSKKEISLDKDKFYGLFVGKGGYWIKGLDRTVKIAEEIYNMDRNFRLIVIGPDKNKIGGLLKKEFIIYINQISREIIPFYYNSSDIFFSLSRYEGGAPTLTVSEGMASGCIAVCSKDSKQEIIHDKKNGIIIDKFNQEEGKKILEILKNKKLKTNIIKESIKTIKKISLKNWGDEYSRVLGI
jgi:glycosyltransferase involved in cell wall biosynthesis